MDIVRKVLVMVVIFVISYLSSSSFGQLYQYLIGSLQGSFVDLRSVFGLPLAYIFFLTILFTAFGGERKYWWMGVLLIPAAIFEIYFDLSHLYFPVALGLAGWLLGFILEKFVKTMKV